MIWLTADHHFGHTSKTGGIIAYCNRPFKNIQEHDEGQIASWNEVVKFTDTVIHAGDFTLGSRQAARNYLRQLNGKILMLNNHWHHDRKWLSRRPVELLEFYTASNALDFVDPIYVIKRNQYPNSTEHHIVICHYPFAEWDRKHHGAYHFHGHSHGKYQGLGRILDVGVDNAYKLLGEYRPFSLEEAIHFADLNAGR